MKKGIKQGFTLVELIVVITILIILAAIGFVSFSGYLGGVRDANRISQLKSMSDGLELYSIKEELPIPDETRVEIMGSGELIAYQGYIGADVIEAIGYNETGLDPKDKTYFSYYLTKNKKYFQLLALLEEVDEDVLALNSSYAAINYSNRYVKVKGDKLGILTDSNNTPLQEIPTVSGSLNIDNVDTLQLKAFLTSIDKVEGTSTDFAGMKKVVEVGGRFCSDGNLECDEEVFKATNNSGNLSSEIGTVAIDYSNCLNMTQENLDNLNNWINSASGDYKYGYDEDWNEVNLITKENWCDVDKISIYESNLTSIPSEIGFLQKITYLDLDTNQLTSLPSEIFYLTNLTELYLDTNQLTSLPSEIGQLTNLTRLYLDTNQLTSLPSEIGQLTNLTRLSLTDNQLTSLPSEIGQLTNLTGLYLNNNTNLGALSYYFYNTTAARTNNGITISHNGSNVIITSN